MSVKEENEKLVAENARLVKTNTDISASINASKLALEEARSQELAGKSLLVDLHKEIEETCDSLEVAKKVLYQVNNEVAKAQSEKNAVELSISTTQKEAFNLYETNKSKHEAELKSIISIIDGKRIELAELLNKIKIETSNLITVKSELSLLDIELSKAHSIFDAVVAKCKVKDEELDVLNNEYSDITLSITKAKQILKDTEISTEAYEDRKAKLISEITLLQDDINAAKATIASINTEISELETKRVEKENEYKGSVSKIFELKRREEAVSEREEYARAQFKEAGLEY